MTDRPRGPSWPNHLELDALGRRGAAEVGSVLGEVIRGGSLFLISFGCITSCGVGDFLPLPS